MRNSLKVICKKWNWEKLLCILLILIFILTLIPIIYISQYNHPCADDYGYGMLTHRTWFHTGSIFETFKSAFVQVKDTYYEWQGTYSAVFLMALQPAVFHEKLYFTVPIIMIGSLLASTMFLMKVVMIDYLKTNYFKYLIITVLILILSIQFIPSSVQGFYWFNGAVYYTFFHTIMLILIGVMLLYAKEQSKRMNIRYIIIAACLGLFIGGGNYVTALQTLIIQVTIGFVLCYYKNKKWRLTVIPILFTSFGFFISVIAPGNSVRQAFFSENDSAVSAIIHSFQYALKHGTEWTSLWVIVAMIVALPIIWNMVLKVEFSFKYPLLVFLFSYCLFASMFTPTLYAMGDTGAKRVWGIRYFTFLLILFLNLIYSSGWLAKSRLIKHLNINNINKRRMILSGYIIITIVLLLLTGTKVGIKNSTSYYAFQSLQSGEAKKYDNILDKRLVKYKDADIKEVVVKKLTVKPRLLYFDDITTDPNDYRNKSLAQYYEKSSIYIKK